MKKNPVLLISVAAFVALFYNREPGLNFSLFTIMAWGAVFLTTQKANHTATFWWLTGALSIATGAFAWYGDPISFLAVFASLVVLTCKAHHPVLNVLLVPFAGAANFISFIFRAPVLTRWLPVNGILTRAFYKKAIYYFLLPALLAAIFLIIYSSSSDLFQSFFHINWNADFLQIGFLTALGFFLMFCFIHYWTPPQLFLINNRLGDHFQEAYRLSLQGGQHPDAGFHRKSAEISLILLNMLVLFFIVTYCFEQFGNTTTAGSLSTALHERVYLLIFSIAMAILVIMLFFKGSLNFDTKARLLRNSAYIWILLNLFLAGIVALKNNQYIEAYGLTFKRIGVHIFLLLCITGLLLTILKIKNRRTNTYLAGRMLWAFYATLVIGCAVNWSWIVTKYNLEHQQSFDMDYARSLPYNRQLLYNTRIRQETPDKKTPFIQQIEAEQKRPLLSKTLYYQFIKF
ncbi:DUF4153 domain-containing protein [Niabella drilacis]|uniref:Uncharacterized protein n=1 Tax=Niabella drilacis (strain DSM 25811 / CCM 8410 / CCUG 62505 / LMG 26954 / E90) TaxID=1285928 RepID=A0A1G6SE49_NIADE|nr:DUF4173 domain-containing protein [Niabella drilacis]SDD15168.1 protein of unknown function [Niabella drilacis]